MNKRTLTPEEKRLWHHFTQDVQHVNTRVVDIAASEVESVTPSVMMKSNMPIARPSTSIDLQPDDMASVHRRTAQRLRRGQETPQATLDLHGYTQMQASHQFHQFLYEASQSGLRVVRVVTGYGKMTGKGVLKAALPRWVNFPENRRLILTYHQARPEDGGSGAWILFLKRKERL